jgi:hypothetical protein
MTSKHPKNDIVQELKDLAIEYVKERKVLSTVLLHMTAAVVVIMAIS